MTDPELEKKSAAVVGECQARISAAMVHPYDYQLDEDYHLIQIQPLTDGDGALSAAELIARYGRSIAQIVRGETTPLSDDETAEILSSRLSYFPNDLLVVGWSAALVYDTAEGAGPTIQLLAYANSQLLEFRHYDELLTQILGRAYALLEQKMGFFARWRLAKSARNLHTTLLDVAELTERADNAIKFLSDMFAARLYKLAAAKVGVPDYKEPVSRKVKTAEDLYNYMVDQFNQSRAFFLEFTVVLILLIELYYLFRGKPL